MKDFFISFNTNDKAMAEWITYTIEDGGFTTTFQLWDFKPGDNFILKMNQAAIECKRTIAVFSPHYFSALFTQSEWAAAFVLDPTSIERKLIPVKVAACEPAGILRSLVYCDLTDVVDEEQAKKLLLAAVSEGRNKPAKVPFPKSVPAKNSGVVPAPPQNKIPTFKDDIPVPAPGSFDSIIKKELNPNDELYKAVKELHGLLNTTKSTFFAQANLRDELHAKAQRRLGITEHLEYESFFRKYYNQLNDEEKKLHLIIRGYTENILSDYNNKMLEIISKHEDELEEIPNLNKLKQHLLVWKTKFNSSFKNDSSICLVYVGVEENVPFPKTIDDEVKLLLEKLKKKLF